MMTLEERERQQPQGKFCGHCKTVKPIRDFSPGRKGDYTTLQGPCRPCNSLIRRQYPFKQSVRDRHARKRKAARTV